MPSAKPSATLDDGLTCTRIPSELVELYALVRLVNSRLTNRLTCFYCGETATDEDHAIPHSLLHGIGHKRTGYETDTLPCCHECNGLLSSQVFNTLAERKDYLDKRLRQRYVGELKAPPWTDAELAELGDGLRSHAMAVHLTREAIARRLIYLSQAGLALADTVTDAARAEVARSMAMTRPRQASQSRWPTVKVKRVRPLAVQRYRRDLRQQAIPSP